MAHVVELVAMHNESIGLISHHVFVAPHLCGMGWVKIAVRFLCGCNYLHDSIELRFKFWVIL